MLTLQQKKLSEKLVLRQPELVSGSHYNW